MNALIDIPEPPRNVEAEMMLIGCLMQDNSTIDYAADRLQSNDFYEPINGHIFDLIISEHSQGRPVNPITLKPFVADWDALNELGGVRHLVKLAGEDGALIGFTGFVAQIAEMARRRTMIDGLQKASAMASNMETDLESIITTADGAVAGNNAHDGVEQLSGFQAVNRLLESYDNPSYGVSCGIIPSLDAALGPIAPKELVILAARPGMGKTACALSYALGAARKGFGVLFVSLEMAATELAGRMVADLCFDGNTRVPYDSIKTGDLSEDQMHSMRQARGILDEIPLRIVDAGKLTTGRLQMLIMRNKRRMEAAGQTLDLVIVDYLQLLSPDTATRGMYEKISEVSMALKSAAKTHGVAIMALAQLSREVEKRPDKRPQLSDLRDSGQIEQDADGVLFLLRDAYYELVDRPEDPDQSWLDRFARMEHVIEFIVAKRRNGITGNAKGQFYGKFQAVRG